MKKSLNTVLGVTLLEIMLVLAIAAMVIVMSVRYYQSASQNQKINAALNTVTGIVAAAESYLTAVGTLAAISSANLSPYLPGGALPFSPWGGKTSVAPVGPNSFTITIPSVPTAMCGASGQFTALIQQNAKLSVTSCAAASTVVTVTE